MVLEQLQGQGDVPVSNLSDSPPSNQGLEGPQQPLVLLDHLGQPVEKQGGQSFPRAPWPEKGLGTYISHIPGLQKSP